jgi:hypothetical protein
MKYPLKLEISPMKTTTDTQFKDTKVVAEKGSGMICRRLQQKVAVYLNTQQKQKVVPATRTTTRGVRFYRRMFSTLVPW